ncbi:MAG: response regulator [Zetaproteobacteria bacterium]|nr:response regulator [Zetaproteobacteria bacterium]
MRPISMSVQFAIVTTVLALVSAAITSYFFYQQTEQQRMQTHVERLQEALHEDHYLIESRVARLRDGVNGLVNASAVVRYGDGMIAGERALAELTDLFKQSLQQYIDYTHLRMIDAVSMPGRELLRLERTGDDIVRVAEGALGDASQQLVFTETAKLSPGQIYLSAIHFNREDGVIAQPYTPVFCLATPIFDLQHHLKAVLVVDVNAGVLMPPTGIHPWVSDFFIADAFGRYLVHSQAEKQLAFETGQQASVMHDYEIDIADFLKRHADPVVRDQGWMGEPFLGVGASNELLQMRKFYIDKLHPEQFLLMGVVASGTVMAYWVDGVVHDVLLWAGFLCLAILLMGGLIGYWLCRPLHQLEVVVETIGDGMLVEIPHLSGAKEVVSLSRAITKMVDAVTQSRKELYKSSALLDSQVRERTLDLKSVKHQLEDKNEVLRQALMIAEQATAMRGQFLAAMSHEIRTPLNGVLGLTELLLDTPLNEMQRNQLETIRASGKTLLTILNDVLDFSKIESGKFELNLGEFDVHALIHRVVNLQSAVAESKGLLLMVEEANLQTMVVGDSNRLEQILANLLSNAIKFTESGEVVLVLERVADDASYLTLQFTVRDTGIGMDELEQQRLFQEFVQGNSAISSRFGGTGLGLTISQRLVQMMGGNIEVQSCKGAGSSFQFYLTFPKGSLFDPSMMVTLEHCTVLLAGDDVDGLQFCADALQSLQMDVDLIARNCSDEEILERLQRGNERASLYHFVVLDEDAKGMRLASLIRACPQLVDLCLLVYRSTYDREKDPIVAEYFDLQLHRGASQEALRKGLLSILHGGDAPFSVSSLHHDGDVYHLRSERILLVEDNLVNQQVAKGMLRKCGIEHVDVANHGKEGVAMFEQSHYDLVLMDVQMPEMDGYAATRAIRALEMQRGQRAIPIIALTAHAFDEERMKGQSAGMDDHLSKPFTVNALNNIFNTWLGGSPMNETSSTEEALGNHDQKLAGGGRSPSIDIPTLADMREALGCGVGPILDIFAAQLPEKKGSIQEAMATENWFEVAENAHALKGSGRSMGALILGDLAATVERMAREQELEELGGAIEALYVEIDRCEIALQDAGLDQYR